MAYGLDYDGVIADTPSMKARWLKESRGIDIPPWKTDRTVCTKIIGMHLYEEMINDIYGMEWSLKAPPIKDAIESIIRLSKEGPVYVVTARTPERADYAKEYMEINGIIRYVTEIIPAGKETKQKICEEKGIDKLVDDDLRHLNVDGLNNIQRILLKDGFNEQYFPGLPKGVEFAKNWKEIMGLLRIEI